MSPYRTLIDSPRWREEDLGLPLPDSPHAVSVALPLWKHVIGYEENDPAVHNLLQAGYPRFVFNPIVKRLFDLCSERFARPDETCIAFPSQSAAERCVQFVTVRTGNTPRIQALGDLGIHAVILPQSDFDTAKKCWQHYGEIISSRFADFTIKGHEKPSQSDAKTILRERIAELTGAATEDIYLFPTGMAAMTRAVAATQALSPGLKSGQLGFPYVDVYKVQSVENPGAHLFSQGYEADLESLMNVLEEAPLSAVVCECPGNPLLQSTDLPRLTELLQKHSTPLIIDDTTGTFANIDALRFSDFVVSSLTKAFSGTGDVMGGSLILNKASEHYAEFKAHLDTHYEDLLWIEDAKVLEHNSRDFVERITRMNATTEVLCDYLHTHSRVKSLLYPKYLDRDQYEYALKAGGGYGSLFSIELHDDEVNAPRFFDALRISKGPSLGNNFSIACPYVLLAHYDELEWARSCGVSPNLIRVSVGLEEAEDLIARFDEAFKVLDSSSP